MANQINKFKILNSVVHFVAVLVMDLLVIAKRTTKMLFHKKSVSKHALAIRSDAPVPTTIVPARSRRASQGLQGVSVFGRSLPMYAAPCLRVDGSVATLDATAPAPVVFPIQFLSVVGFAKTSSQGFGAFQTSRNLTLIHAWESSRR